MPTFNDVGINVRGLVLVFVGGVELFRCYRLLVHLSPEVGDVGNDEWDDERHYGHGL